MAESNEPRRWTLRGMRQSDEAVGGRHDAIVEGDAGQFRSYGEVVRVREDVVTDDDVESVLAFVRVARRQGRELLADKATVRELLEMVLGRPDG